jgi:hypothetical protein
MFWLGDWEAKTIRCFIIRVAGRLINNSGWLLLKTPSSLLFKKLVGSMTQIFDTTSCPIAANTSEEMQVSIPLGVLYLVY